MRCPDRDKEAKTQFVVNFCVPKFHLCVGSGLLKRSRLNGGIITIKAPVSSFTVSLKHPCAALGILLGVVTL